MAFWAQKGAGDQVERSDHQKGRKGAKKELAFVKYLVNFFHLTAL